VIRRTAEQLAGRFNPEDIALAIKSSVLESELSVPDALFLLKNRIDSRQPYLPTRDQLLAEAREMFAATKSLDDIVDRASELLVESVGNILAAPQRAQVIIQAIRH
jgi:stearoyl-CoA desaturase (delta-9 desaturase)